MKFHRFNSTIAIGLIWLATLVQPTQAIDIDIYASGDPNADGIPPNLLFAFDNSANWNSNSGTETKRRILHEALYRFVDEIERRNKDSENPGGFVNVNIAMMVGTQSNNPAGGKPLYYFAPIRRSNIATNFPHIREIRSLLYCAERWSNALHQVCWEQGLKQGTATFEEFQVWLNTLNKKDRDAIRDGSLPSANRAKYATQLLEAYHWYAGNRTRAGQADGYLSFDYNAFLPVNNTVYKSPITDVVNNYLMEDEEMCGKNHIVFVGNGAPDSGENSAAESELRALGGSTAMITGLNPNNYESNWIDEYARFLANTDVHAAPGKQTITTHTVDVFDPETEKNNKPLMAAHALLKSTAAAGGGSYIQAANVQELVDGLLKLLKEIQAVNDVFAASALPVSVNVRGTNLNQVYIGVFRPENSQRPRWAGNLKMYQLGFDAATSRVYLADADGKPAANNATGFIDSQARSFWTAGSSYWDNSAIPGGNYDNASDSPDGDLVEKGAAGQKLREQIQAGQRRVFTCTRCDKMEFPLPGFQTNNLSISADKLGVDNAKRDKLINWVRGEDVLEEHTGILANGTPVNARPSAHGDVLHSRPAVINYGTDPSTGKERVLVFYGANDGSFHAVEGGTAEGVFANSGKELWSFIPPEHYSKLNTLYENEVMDKLADKPFFVDGVIGSYVETTTMAGITQASKVYLYLTMRRGGDFIYAMDVTNPFQPKVIWRKGKGDQGFNEMGQTWSAPNIAKIKVDHDQDPTTPAIDKTVLIMGLGYDANANDNKNPGDAIHTTGRGIIMLDHETGEIVWQAGPSGTNSATFQQSSYLRYSVPADLTVIDRDGNGYADRIYFGDTGGQVFRFDIFQENRTKWNIDRIFKPENQRFKFLSAPDVVASTDNSGNDIVVIASGDRENPFEDSVQNYILILKDPLQNVANSNLPAYYIPREGTTSADANFLADGSNSKDLTGNFEAANRGWYIKLNTAEKGISRPAIVNGIVFLNTYEPGGYSDCAPSLGIARSYQFDVMTGKAVTDNNADGELKDDDRAILVPGGGLIPDPVPVIVEIDGKLREAIISGTQVQQFPNTQLERRVQTFWKVEADD